MRRGLRWTSVVVLVLLTAALVAAGLVRHELDHGASLFQSGGTWFRTGSDTSYGGPLGPGQTYAEEGPRFTNTTSRTVTLRDIALDHWCVWLGPGHCTPTSSVRVVKVLYMKGYGLLTNDRWPLSERYKTMVPLLRPLSTPIALRPGTKIDTIYVLEASRPGVYLMPGRWIDYSVTAFGLFHRSFHFHEPGQWGLCVRPASCPSWANRRHDGGAGARPHCKTVVKPPWTWVAGEVPGDHRVVWLTEVVCGAKLTP
jgi:hypothetical protein